MNILILTQRWYPDTFGGSENVAAEQARRLAERGHRVLVLTEYTQAHLPPEEKIPLNPPFTKGEEDKIHNAPQPPLNLRGGGIVDSPPLVGGVRGGGGGSLHLIRYGRPTQFQKWGSSLMDVRVLPKLIRALHKKNQFDLAILHHPYPAYGFFKARLRRASEKIPLNPPFTKGEAEKVPSLYVFHASTAREAEVEGLRRKFKGLLLLLRPVFVRGFIWLTRLVERRVLKKADRIVLFSEFSRQVLQEICPLTLPSPQGGEGKEESGEKILKIKSGIDGKIFFPPADKREAKEELGFSPDKPIILTVRRLTARMGLIEFLYASLSVREYLPEAKILIIGEGPVKEDILNEIDQLNLRGCVALVGRVPLKDLPLYYQAADLFVLPTAAFEGLGMATLEALAAGLPVVGTPVGATPEILNKIDSGLITKSAAAADLAQGIIDFFRRPSEEREALAKKCRELAEREYGWEEAVEELEELIKNLK